MVSSRSMVGCISPPNALARSALAVTLAESLTVFCIMMRPMWDVTPGTSIMWRSGSTIVLVLGAKTPNFFRQARTSGICLLLEVNSRDTRCLTAGTNCMNRPEMCQKLPVRADVPYLKRRYVPNCHRTQKSDIYYSLSTVIEPGTSAADHGLLDYKDSRSGIIEIGIS